MRPQTWHAQGSSTTRALHLRAAGARRMSHHDAGGAIATQAQGWVCWTPALHLLRQVPHAAGMQLLVRRAAAA